MIDIRTARGEGERAVFLGNTDSGKTFLIQQLAAPMQSVVVMDSKGDSMWDSYAARHGYLVSGDPADIRRRARVIFRVDSRSLMDRAGWTKPGSAGHVWTDALASCWFRSESGVTLVIFDEALDTLPSAGGAHPDARRIFTSGRTQGLPAWLGAQFPIYVDRRALGTAEHCFSFAQPMTMQYNWDPLNQFAFLITNPTPGNSGKGGASCIVINATKFVCTLQSDSSPSVLIMQK